VIEEQGSGENEELSDLYFSPNIV